jgi:hypothetical protein
MGTYAGMETRNGDGNVFIGYESGRYNQGGTRNVFLGNRAGIFEQGSNKLYITNFDSDSSNSLVWGHFAARLIRFNANAGIGIAPDSRPLSVYSPIDAGTIALYGKGNAADYTSLFLGSDTTDRSTGYILSHTKNHSFLIGDYNNNNYSLGFAIDSFGNVGIKTTPGFEDLLIADYGDISHLKLKGLGNQFDYAMLSLESHGQDPNTAFNISHTKSNDLVFVYYNGTDYQPPIRFSSNGRLTINNWAEGTEVLDVNGNARIRGVGSAASANDLRITGDGTLTTSTSDARLKTDFQPIENGLEKVLNMEGLTFSWIDDISRERDAGLLAQEVLKSFPEAVFMNETDGYLGINYSRFPALFVEAFKEQQSIIEAQKTRIELQGAELQELRSRLERIESMIE